MQVLVEVSRACKLRVYAPPPKMRLLRATDLPADVWTSDEGSSCVRVVPIFHLTFRSMAATLAEARRKYALYFKCALFVHAHGCCFLERRYGFTRLVAFRPTGWVGGIARATHDQESLILVRFDDAFKIVPRVPHVSWSAMSPSQYGVPYSEHSSFPELRALLAYVRPRKIIPTVGNGSGPKSAQIVSLFADLLPGDGASVTHQPTEPSEKLTAAIAVLQPKAAFTAPRRVE